MHVSVELHDLRDSHQVERSQDQAQSMLREHTLAMAVRARRSGSATINSLVTPPLIASPADDMQRFGRLLLVLPLLKTVRARALERAFFHGTSLLSGATGHVSVERLLCEMFKNW